MQLFLVIALMLLGGKSGARELLEEVKPVIEELGGEEVKEALKSAEEISEALAAVQNLAGAVQSVSPAAAYAADGQSEPAERAKPAIAFPLAPVNDIADGEILACLSKYIASQQT